jgi:hypothetical protein
MCSVGLIGYFIGRLIYRRQPLIDTMSDITKRSIRESENKGSRSSVKRRNQKIANRQVIKKSKIVALLRSQAPSCYMFLFMALVGCINVNSLVGQTTTITTPISAKSEPTRGKSFNNYHLFVKPKGYGSLNFVVGLHNWENVKSGDLMELTIQKNILGLSTVTSYTFLPVVRALGDQHDYKN